jgi:predicted phage terminase large subunit-like protein
VSPAAQEDLILRTAHADGYEVRISIPVDPGSAGKAWFDHLRHRLYEYDVIATRPTSAKQVRWTPMLAAFERGDVGMLEGAWNREVEDELKRLPGGKHDDCADALADAMQALSEARRTTSDERLHITLI